VIVDELSRILKSQQRRFLLNDMQSVANAFVVGKYARNDRGHL